MRQTSVGVVETVGLAKIVEEPCNCFAESGFEPLLRCYALYNFKYIRRPWNLMRSSL